MEEVKEWLCKNGLEKYCQNFEDNGWDDINLLPRMTSVQIRKCIHKDGHVAKFRKAVRRIKDFENEPEENNSDFETEPEGTDFVLCDREANLYASDQRISKRTPLRADRKNKHSEDFSRHSQLLRVADTSSISDKDLQLPVAVKQDRTSFQPENLGHFTYIAHSDNTTINKSSASQNNLPLDTAVENQRGQMQAIAEWHEQSEKLFVKTRAYQECKEILEDRHWVTVLGKPGDGKTTMAAHLMSEYRKKGFEAVFVTSTQDWKTFVACEENKKQFVVIDDMFGSTCVDKFKLNEWLSNLEMMTKIVTIGKGNVVVICTSRKHIFEDVKSSVIKFRPFAESMLHDLTNRRWKLNGEEKYDIFEKYANENSLETFSLREIENLDPPIGFPHCVSMYCTNIYLRQKGIMFFKNPIDCIQQEIRSFQECDRIKYMLLLLVLLNKNKLQSCELEKLCYEPTSQYKNILKAAGVPVDISCPDAMKGLNSLSGSYLLQRPNRSYSFLHDSLLENLAKVFVDSNPALAIELLPLNYLTSIDTKDNEVIKEEDTHIMETPYHLPAFIRRPLVERLTREIKRGNVFYSCSCNAWLDPNFVKEWIGYVTNNCEELKKIFCTRATVCDNVIISLTELDMENSVTAILNNNTVKETLKQYSEWHDVLQRGLEISCIQIQKVSLVKAFSSALPTDAAFKLQGTELLLHALRHSDRKCAITLLERTHIDTQQGDFELEFSQYFEHANYTQFLVAKKIAELLSDLGVNITPSKLHKKSQFRISTAKTETVSSLMKGNIQFRKCASRMNYQYRPLNRIERLPLLLLSLVWLISAWLRSFE